MNAWKKKADLVIVFSVTRPEEDSWISVWPHSASPQGFPIQVHGSCRWHSQECESDSHWTRIWQHGVELGPVSWCLIGGEGPPQEMHTPELVVALWSSLWSPSAGQARIRTRIRNVYWWNAETTITLQDMWLGSHTHTHAHTHISFFFWFRQYTGMPSTFASILVRIRIVYWWNAETTITTRTCD